MNKKSIIVIIVLILIIAFIIGFYFYFKSSNSNKKKKEEQISLKTNESITNDVEIEEEKEENQESINSKEVENENNSNYYEEKIRNADKPNLNESDSKSSDVTINVGDYDVRCGKYKGLIEENGKSSEMIIEITEDNIIKMNNQDISFSIGQNKLICDSGASFNVTGDNKIVYEMDKSIEFSYEE